MVSLNLLIPEKFYMEEIRCGYKIDSKMKEVWAVELDLLDKLLSVCKKYGIQIFAAGGTMLGAVRHGGFIPWDDDIDMMMLRKDYNRLCEVAQREFAYPYFFQTEYTDVGSLRGHAQLRNSQTTGILKSESEYKYKFNQGIFIDIFPLDAVIDDEQKFKKQLKESRKAFFRARQIAKITSRYRERSGLKGIVICTLHMLLGNLITNIKLEERAYKKFERLCEQYNYDGLDRVATFSFNPKAKHRFKADFEATIDVPFEFLSIPVCIGYDRVLKQQYGDYMKPVKEGSYHGGVIFDVDKSYTYYIGAKENE